MIFRDLFVMGCTGGLSRLCYLDFEAGNLEEARMKIKECKDFIAFEGIGGKIFHLELQVVERANGGTYRTVSTVEVTPPPYLEGKHREEFIEKGAETYMREKAVHANFSFNLQSTE